MHYLTEAVKIKHHQANQLRSNYIYATEAHICFFLFIAAIAILAVSPFDFAEEEIATDFDVAMDAQFDVFVGY